MLCIDVCSICPGKQLADSTIFMAISMCLATLNISRAKNEKGEDIVPKYEVTDAFIRSVVLSWLFYLFLIGLLIFLIIHQLATRNLSLTLSHPGPRKQKT